MASFFAGSPPEPSHKNLQKKIRVLTRFGAEKAPKLDHSSSILCLCPLVVRDSKNYPENITLEKNSQIPKYLTNASRNREITEK
jgi:hypothetical protein